MITQILLDFRPCAHSFPAYVFRYWITVGIDAILLNGTNVDDLANFDTDIATHENVDAVQ